MLFPFRTRGWRATVVFAALAVGLAAEAAQVSVDVAQDRVAVSPFLYGKNQDADDDPQHPVSAAVWQQLRDAGVRFVREHGGNNGTKYNWQRKLGSHPDWYNNVYAHDWDYAQASVQQHLPGVQCMWCFQLLGKVADNAQHNFDDWSYNRSQGWTGTNQNLAGGGVLNPSGGQKAAKDGDISLYLTNTDAATSTAILDHWIKTSELGLDRRQFQYWNMDNEPEIWSGTHDDAMPTQLSAEEFMQRYFAYARAARARFPEIKLAGPVTANEWQWYRWATPITADGRTYPWLEYFIKRIGEEQTRTGVRLLDVLDIHYYPGATQPADVVQLHRTFYDPTFVNPDANGVHAVNGGWDTSITQEYIFGRCEQWLTKYLGPKHGVTFGLTETGIAITNAPVASVWYASTLGEFMQHGVEVFTPWTWQPGMWEVLHLFSRYNYATAVRAVSDDEQNVSAYVTTDDASGNLTVVLVNRALSASKAATVTCANAALPDGVYSTLQLANLPATETFVSHGVNALVSGTVAVASNRFSLTLPPLSITSVLLKKSADVPPPTGPARLANVSVRAQSGTGDNVLIVGFYVGGTGSKPLLLRGIGPTLTGYGVTSALPDPVLSLVSQTRGAIGSNDDWGSNAAEITPLSVRVGAFALEAASHDSALATSLPTGSYSALIADKAGVTGVVLGETYDADPAGPARFTNVSARTWVGTGANSLIAGFVVTGASSKTLLVRAVGPGLASYGVTGVMSDPFLSVYRQGDAAPLFVNDDWSTISYADQIATTAKTVGAFELAPGSKDAVLLLTLPAGSYSAVVTGSHATTGVALVEVYEVQ